MTTETINGTTLAYDLVGDGPPLILIHGSWGERQTWGFVLPGLSESFRVVSYDRRGHGESVGDPTAGTVHDDVADAAALIETVHGEPAHVVANSYGSIIALRLAAEHPELVRTMFCHEPPALGILMGTEHEKIVEEKRPSLEKVRRLLESGDSRAGAEYFVENVALGPGAWALFPPPMQDMFVRNAQTYLGELRDPEAVSLDRAGLSQLRMPVLLTHGDQSPSWFPLVAQQIDESAPAVRLQLLPGVGHVPHLTHPDDFVALATSHLLG